MGTAARAPLAGSRHRSASVHYARKRREIKFNVLATIQSSHRYCRVSLARDGGPCVRSYKSNNSVKGAGGSFSFCAIEWLYVCMTCSSDDFFILFGKSNFEERSVKSWVIGGIGKKWDVSIYHDPRL